MALPAVRLLLFSNRTGTSLRCQEFQINSFDCCSYVVRLRTSYVPFTLAAKLMKLQSYSMYIQYLVLVPGTTCFFTSAAGSLCGGGLFFCVLFWSHLQNESINLVFWQGRLLACLLGSGARRQWSLSWDPFLDVREKNY